MGNKHALGSGSAHTPHNLCRRLYTSDPQCGQCRSAWLVTPRTKISTSCRSHPRLSISLSSHTVALMHVTTRQLSRLLHYISVICVAPITPLVVGDLVHEARGLPRRIRK